MKMKSLVSIFVFIAFSATTKAQTSASKTNEKDRSPGQNAFYAGFEYANLTDVRMESTFEYFDGVQNVTKKETQKGGTQMGIAGLSFGYQIKNPNGNPININTGLRVMQTFNKSEYGDNKITFYIPEFNVGYLVTENFETYGGFSIPILRGSAEVNKYESRGGLNLGIAAHATEQFTIKAAYNVYAFHYKFEDSTFNGKLDFAISGLAITTQMNF